MSDYRPQVAPGSVYSVQITRVSHAKYALTQDNGEQIVVHHDDLQLLIELLTLISKGDYYEN